MVLYTGQFSKAEIYTENYLVVCSIARYDPPWFRGLSVKELAPSKELLAAYKSGMSFGSFSKEFLSYLATVNFQDIFDTFEALSDEYSGIVLCCHENQTQFCHRHLVASYLNSNFQLGITEYPLV